MPNALTLGSAPMCWNAGPTYLSDETIAGTIAPLCPMMLWQADEERNCTHFHASVMCLVPDQMESPSELPRLQLWPSGPLGIGANTGFRPLVPTSSVTRQLPSMIV